MSFQEKSALMMIVILLVAGAFYINNMLAIAAAAPDTVERVALVPIFAVYVVIVVVLSVIGHIIIAILNPSEASDKLDEREKLFAAKAGNFSGIILGIGVVGSLLNYFWTQNGNWLFHTVFLSLMGSQILEYAARIFFYRRGY